MAEKEETTIADEFAAGFAAIARGWGEIVRRFVASFATLGGRHADSEYADVMLAEHRAAMQRQGLANQTVGGESNG